MSEPENFLSRWARLKREAGEATEAKETPEAAAPETAAEAARPVEPVDEPDEAKASPSTEPAFDMSTLPPIESITAATDIRAFLKPGVPPDLARAALRRAWVADPAIRDFVGIAENQWDFNDPNAIPGFGPLGPLDDVRRLVAQVMGDFIDRSEDAAAIAEKSSTAIAANSDSVAVEAQEFGATESVLPAVENAQHPGTLAPSEPGEVHAAPQQDDEGEPTSALAEVAPRRSHGGALPR